MLLSQGHRTFFGPKKCITLNKRRWIKLFLDPELDEDSFGREVRKIAAETGHVLSRTGRDVVGYPVPRCMCQTGNRPPEIARDASLHPEKRDSFSPPEAPTSEEIQHLSDAEKSETHTSALERTEDTVDSFERAMH